MRIGKVVIDTDSMSVEELNIIIDELRKVRKRKERMNHYLLTIHDLIENAKEEGFIFLNKDTRYFIGSEDLTIYDDGEPTAENGQ